MDRTGMTEENNDPVVKLAFHPRDDGYVLIRVSPDGERTELLLSLTEIMMLSRVLSSAQSRILQATETAAMGRQGISARAAIPVRQIEIAPNLLEDSILLTVHDQFGNAVTYALPAPRAAELADLLPPMIADLRRDQPKQ
jgi:hypothetical protein